MCTMAKEVKVKVTYETKDATKKAKELKSVTGEVTDQVDKLSGGAITSFRNFRKGIGSVIGSLKTLRGGLIATGLGAFLVLAASVAEWFMNTREGAKLLDQALAGVGAVLGQLGAAFSALTKGDFSGVLDAISGIGGAVKDSVQAVETLTQAEDELFALNESAIKRQAELAGIIRANEKIMMETTRSAQERKNAVKAINDAEREQQELTEKRINIEKEILDAQLVTENNENKRRELKLKIAELDTELINLETERAVRAVDTQKTLEEIDRQALEGKQKLTEEEKERQKEQAAAEAKRVEDLMKQQRVEDDIRMALMEEGEEKELMMLAAKYDKMREMAGENEELLREITERQVADDIAIREKHSKQREELANKEAQTEILTQKAIRDARMMTAQLTANTLGNISELFDQSEKSSKAFAIAEVLANQGIALSGALANAFSPADPLNALSGGLAGVLKYATLAASITGSAAQIKRIIGSSGGARGAGMTIPTGQTSAIPQVSRPQDIPTDFGAVRSYVLVGDVNNGQEVERRLENLSTL